MTAIVVIGVLGAWLAWAQSPPSGQASGGAPAGGEVVATVEGRAVTREELKARETQALQDYRQRLGQDVPREVRPIIRRQLLENLIRRELLAIEAARQGISGTDAEAEALLRKDPFFNPDGKFDVRRFDAVKQGQPENFRNAIEKTRQQLGALKLSDQLERDFAPPASELRGEVERALSKASASYLALRLTEFSGIGGEPREQEVIDSYRADARRFLRPAEATLTIVMVDQPPLPEGVSPDSPEGRNWRTAMRARADSALASARGGSSLEGLAEAVGSLRRSVVVNPDNFPGYWQGDAREGASVFSARTGSLLAAPVAARSGWMVVRVDEVRPERVAPLKDVARQVRAGLRGERRLHGEDRVLRELYERRRATLATTGWNLRYAVFDTLSIPVPEPSGAEIDRWYRAHQADFSQFDASKGTIRVQPLAEVRENVVTRLKSERRRDAVGIAASQLAAAWQRGQRDSRLERSATLLREVGPVIEGSPVDTGAAGGALATEIARDGWRPRAGTFPYGRGTIAYQVIGSVPGFVPPFEQVRKTIEAERASEVAGEEENGARALYERDPSQFAQRNVIHYGMVVIEPPNPLTVPLTRSEVERYYRDHIDRYSAAEVVRVREILVTPRGQGPEADSEARERARKLLERARAGEDFAELARRNSDDPATRDKGGDLGEFGRGTLLPGLDELAFSLKPGEISDVYRTEVGYHILRCISHEPLYAHDLRYAYTNVGFDAAMERADSIAIRRCDSLSAALPTADAARALARSTMRGAYTTRTHVIGDRTGSAELVSFLIRLENTGVGRVVPGRGFDRSTGNFVGWVDSIAPARTLSWNEARTAAIEAYRRGAAQRALDAKRAELDSLLMRGWTMDSVATLFGGWEESKEFTPRQSIAGMGGSEIVDSLVFGTGRTPPVLKPGQTSSWLSLPGGLLRFQLEEVKRPDASSLAAQLENERRIRLERRLGEHFDDLKKRHAVRILDPALRDTPLPPPPSSRLP